MRSRRSIYCSDKCQEEHRPQREQECKERAAELREEILFKQPKSSHLGDCPICYLPLSCDTHTSIMKTCCSKVICDGCVCANTLRQREEKQKPTCPFCRYPIPKSQKEIEVNVMKRIEVNDPVAMCHVTEYRYKEGNYENAVEYLTKAAAELGNVGAHYGDWQLYMRGKVLRRGQEKGIIPFGRGCHRWTSQC